MRVWISLGVVVAVAAVVTVIGVGSSYLPTRCPTIPDDAPPLGPSGETGVKASRYLERQIVGFILEQMDDEVVMEVLGIEKEWEKRPSLHWTDGYFAYGNHTTGPNGLRWVDDSEYYDSLTVRFRVNKPERYRVGHEFDEAAIRVDEIAEDRPWARCEVVDRSSWILDPLRYQGGPLPPGTEPPKSRTGPGR